jgi:PIN domain nuclease of toxin-antitoxin system
VNLLLDTHIFLWAAADDGRLAQRTRELIVAADNVYVSSASIWEIAIKARLGKLNATPDELFNELDVLGYFELPINSAHAAMTYRLPMIHRDPFDRLLIAQAMSEDLRLVTADARLAEYTDLVMPV